MTGDGWFKGAVRETISPVCEGGDGGGVGPGATDHLSTQQPYGYGWFV